MATRLLRLIAFLIACFLLAVPVAVAQSKAITAQVDALGQGGFPEREAAMSALVATGDARVVPILQALSDGTLYTRKSDSKVVIATKAGSDLALKDPLDGTALGNAASSDIEKIKINNGLRGKLKTLMPAAVSERAVHAEEPAPVASLVVPARHIRVFCVQRDTGTA